MLRWITLAVSVVVATALATFLLAYAPDPVETTATPVNLTKGPKPKVEIEGKRLYDFGTMTKQTKSSHTWVVKNVGEADLHVWLEKTTCSCTIASLAESKKAEGSSEKPKVIVKPGQSTPIDVGWDTKEWTDFSQNAILGTNDPIEPEVTLFLKGKVTPPVVVYPPEMITFGSNNNEEKHTKRIAIYSPDRPETKITKILTSRPDLIVATSTPFGPEEIKSFPTKAGYRIDVEIKPGMPLGKFHEQMVIYTDHPKQNEVKVSMNGEFTGPISVMPSRLRLPVVTSAKGGTGHVTLLVRGAKPTKFEVAEKPEKLLVAVAPDDSNNQKGRYRLTVSVPPGISPGVIEGQIVIKTDHPNATELKIPVSVFVSLNAG
jgi:Protein of unknown function (DUF1573)